MNIVIKQQEFLPHRDCHLELKLALGQILIIKGENGIGKSTLSRWIKEHHSTEVTLIEQPALSHFYNRQLKDLKNILLRSLEGHFDEHRFQQVWQDLRLSQIEGHFLHALSGGENQSLKLAIGLAMRNKIVILDEPSQYLDQSRKQILAQLIKLMMKDYFIVVIEHDSSWLTEVESQQLNLKLHGNLIEGEYV